jgi:hypothetical protein
VVGVSVRQAEENPHVLGISTCMHGCPVGSVGENILQWLGADSVISVISILKQTS